MRAAWEGGAAGQARVQQRSRRLWELCTPLPPGQGVAAPRSSWTCAPVTWALEFGSPEGAHTQPWQPLCFLGKSQDSS